MTIDFPASPTTGDTYEFGSRKWTWTGSGWQATSITQGPQGYSLHRPFSIQERGIISDRFTILSVDCIQLMPDEMVNDPQFQAYAN